jgi:hypothetical protein
MIQPTGSHKSSSVSISMPKGSNFHQNAGDVHTAMSLSHNMKSQSIPISNNILRTASELQLCMDEHIADQRDYAFFSRLVNGISQTQNFSKDRYLQMENQVCLSHIMETRQGGQQQGPEDWSLGISIDAPMDREHVHAIASDALALATTDEEGIFELDL